MLEIPGEEAPTDPGLEMRKKQEAIAASQARTKKTVGRIVGAVLTGIIFVAGGISYLYVQHQLNALVYNLDDVYIPPRDMLMGAPPPPEPEQVVVASAQSNGGRTPRPPAAATPETLPLPNAAPVANAAPRPTTTVKYVPPSGSGGNAEVALSEGGAASVGIGGADIGVSRVGDDVLSDNEAIFKMAKAAIAAYGPQIETCAAQRMKQDESFSGAWKLNLTIQKDGTTAKVKAAGVKGGDAELEACMQRAAQSWRFARIAREFPIAKTYSFTSSSF